VRTPITAPERTARSPGGQARRGPMPDRAQYGVADALWGVTSMPSVIFSGETLDGTAAGELIAGISAFGTNHTINAGGGNDLVLGEMDYFKTNLLGAANTSLGMAMSIDGSAWSTSANNPIIGVAGPHTSVYIEPGAGEQRFFSVTVGANETLVADIDFASGTAWGNTDVMVDILDVDGNVLATNDDASSDFGSVGSFDSRLTYTPTEAGTYYIRVREFDASDGNTFEGGEQIFLNVSVTNHAASGAGAITAGNDTINGGDGNDTIFGMLGTDTVHGDAGNDIIASTGDGSYFGDDGNDTIYANSTLTTETLDGGAGIDLLDTTHWSSTYVIDLATGSTNYGGESFVNFENLRAGSGNDTLSGTAGDNNIRGGAGQDTVNGLGGNDTVLGQGGNDTLNGGDGDDVLTGGDVNSVLTGNDTLNGGAGNDTLAGGDGVDVLNGGDGDDDVTISFANGAEAHGGTGVDTLHLHISSGTIALDGNSFQGADMMLTFGFENLDSSASSGDVTVIGTTDVNHILTGFGNDTIYGAQGADIIFSGAGDDLLGAFSGNFALDGGDGNDTYNGANYVLSGHFYWNLALGFHGLASFADPVIGTLTNIENFIGMTGDAHEHVRGTGVANLLSGNGGNDYLYGKGGSDTLLGEEGADLLDGGAGADAMAGGAGDDLYYVDHAGDAVTELGGEGVDRVIARLDYTLGAEVENLTLKGALAQSGTGNALDNVLRGTVGDNTLDGLGGIDELYGNDGDDTLLGGGGADRLEGGAGRDTINGGTGDDQLVGGANKDTLFGGDGADTFFFDDGEVGGGASSADIVLDFDHAEGDKVHVRQIDANTGAGGDQNFTFIGTGAFTGVAGQLHYLQAGGNTFVEGDTDGDGNADFVIRLDGLVSLVAGDFVL